MSEWRFRKTLHRLEIDVQSKDFVGDSVPVLDDRICGVHYGAIHVEEYTGKCKYFCLARKRKFLLEQRHGDAV